MRERVVSRGGKRRRDETRHTHNISIYINLIYKADFTFNVFKIVSGIVFPV
jgi:hypothetical protein